MFSYKQRATFSLEPWLPASFSYINFSSNPDKQVISFALFYVLGKFLLYFLFILLSNFSFILL
jgi:hypothetical protein